MYEDTDNNQWQALHHGGEFSQSTIASTNHASVSRSWKMRYTAPSPNATSHSSRFHAGRQGGQGWRGGLVGFVEVMHSSAPAPPALPASPALPAPPAPPVHQSPDVRHGPAACTTAPPANPRRSV